MKAIFNYVLLLGIVLGAISCASPEDPTAADRLVGRWEVIEYYVDGQSQDNLLDAFDRFVLERDGSFLLEDENALVTVGTWDATDTSLTLSGSDGSSRQFTIEFISFEKMQIVQTISSPTIGTIELRYLMNHEDADTYQGSGN